MEEYIIPASRFSIESRVANSRFIATISPVFTVQEAKDFILEIKKSFHDANHNVPVFLVGFGASVIAHSSDDGEPSGTAGRPALAILKGSGLGDTAIVVTRYFGGTKLGTGGLVKAYSESVRHVINQVPKAKKSLVHHVLLVCPYNLYDHIKNIVFSFAGTIIKDTFSENVKLEISIPVYNYNQLKDTIFDISKGQINTKIIRLNQVSLFPQKDFGLD